VKRKNLFFPLERRKKKPYAGWSERGGASFPLSREKGGKGGVKGMKKRAIIHDLDMQKKGIIGHREVKRKSSIARRGRGGAQREKKRPSSEQPCDKKNFHGSMEGTSRSASKKK